jgi:hypothetical protein
MNLMQKCGMFIVQIEHQHSTEALKHDEIILKVKLTVYFFDSRKYAVHISKV